MGTPCASVLTQRPHSARQPWGAPLYMGGAMPQCRHGNSPSLADLLQVTSRSPQTSYNHLPRKVGLRAPRSPALRPWGAAPGAAPLGWVTSPERRLLSRATHAPALQSEAIVPQCKEENTHEGSLHLVEDDPLEDQGCLGVGGVLVLQPPPLLPERGQAVAAAAPLAASPRQARPTYQKSSSRRQGKKAASRYTDSRFWKSLGFCVENGYMV